ncbi:tetratricopeptide repeat (TPR)-containing protein [Striga asiatica]|uniref:Tetratricopeptide repeat (TPR)-containing protein n=1 Tax=Striga asiatica TaxID=4170 RepID=A0A5A7Q5N8_STRAF|nr:tetratricopeptide repeat (TPR)-containing protein [Striga asiatica]
MAEPAKYTLNSDMGCCFIASFFQLKPKNGVHLQDSPNKKKQLIITTSKTPNKPQEIPRLPSNYKKPENIVLSGQLGNVIKRRQGQFGKMNQNVVTKTPGHTHILLGPKDRFRADSLKSLGNVKYKQGKYEEALAFYDRAISIDPNRACYYGNKSAALIGLARFVEALFQGLEAVRIDSTYHNVHYRLAKLYLRLGVAEEAISHYKCSGPRANPEDIARAVNLRSCIVRCIESKNNGHWKAVLGESQLALCLGADSAPQIYAMKAEALMELHRHEEAFSATQNAPHFSVKLYTEFLGSAATAGILRVRALVYTANGRFEDAVKDIEQALRLDSAESVRLTSEKVKFVALSRLNGNRLFKESKFMEALIEYSKGLEIDCYNSVLLCNRAACRFKLKQYEKSIEDCTQAIAVRPSYSKARLRRANCHAQLEKWEAAIEDYEILIRENWEDQNVRASLIEAKIELSKMQNGCKFRRQFQHSQVRDVPTFKIYRNGSQGEEIKDRLIHTPNINRTYTENNNRSRRQMLVGNRGSLGCVARSRTRLVSCSAEDEARRGGSGVQLPSDMSSNSPRLDALAAGGSPEMKREFFFSEDEAFFSEG